MIFKDRLKDANVLRGTAGGVRSLFGESKVKSKN